MRNTLAVEVNAQLKKCGSEVGNILLLLLKSLILFVSQGRFPYNHDSLWEEIKDKKKIPGDNHDTVHCGPGFLPWVICLLLYMLQQT